MCKRFFIALLLVFFSLHCYGQGASYVITESELSQIKTECENLRNQIKNLKASQTTDSQLLESFELKLKSLEQREIEGQKLLTESNLRLEALKESSKQSKKEALWLNVKIGGISFGIGAALGALAVLIIN